MQPEQIGAGGPKGTAAQGLTLGFSGALPVFAVLLLTPAAPALLLHFKTAPGAALIVPLLVGAPGAMVALFSSIAGLIVDRYGRRWPALLSTVVFGLAGMAPIFFHSLTALLVSRLVLGLAETFVIVTDATLYGDYFSTDDRRKWLAMSGFILTPIATISLIAAGAMTEWRWNGAFWLFAVAWPLLAAKAIWYFEPARPAAHEETVREPFPWTVVAGYCAVALAASVLFNVFVVNVGLAFHAVGVDSARTLGLLLAVASLGAPLGALIFQRISAHLPGRAVIAVSMATMGGGVALIGASPASSFMTGAAFLDQIGAGMTVTGLILWLSQLLPASQRGRGAGLFATAYFAGQFVCPLVVSAATSLVGGLQPGLVVLGVAGLLGGLALAAKPRFHQAKA